MHTNDSITKKKHLPSNVFSCDHAWASTIIVKCCNSSVVPYIIKTKIHGPIGWEISWDNI